jgi:CRP/FNR family transcriptional regulator, cyclic AMP receptor protein
MRKSESSPPNFDTLPESLRLLAQRAAIMSFRKGQRLIEEGQHGDTLYIILSGSVRAFGSSERGREITYGAYGPGEYVGEMSLDGGLRAASVEAVKPTWCAMVTRYTLTRHIAEHPEFAFELLTKVIRRARAATLSAKQLALNDVYGRLKDLLASVSAERPDGNRIVAERLTHQEMANRVGSSREMITRLMKDLEQGGYVGSEDARIVLLRPLPSRW